MTPGLILDTYDEGERNALSDAMDVMARAFDPAFGEAWTLPQLSGVMTMPGTWLTIARIDAAPLGFALVRSVLDECELLLLAVSPSGAAGALARRCCSTASGQRAGGALRR